MPAPEICPNCGAVVPRTARVCPDCGSDEETGWADQAVSQRLGIPDDSFDHDQFVREEFGQKSPPSRPPGGSWFWWAVALLLLLVFTWRFLG
ncbi:MAG: hypothetical protein JNN07_03605 [Verrucomicrobiales bacterium]|nr:hypothetical protein [Verrucomicrobiales bacterium]